MRDSFAAESDTLLRVRITKKVQEAYSLVQDYYETNQSDLVRMAPLLLVLLAEKHFAHSRKEIRDLEEKLVGSSSASEVLRIYRDTLLRLKGQHFVEYLRELAGELDETGRKAVGPKDIDLAKDGLPDYQLFRATFEELEKEQGRTTLQQVANEVAKTVDNADSVPRDGSGTIPPQYDGHLLAICRTKLGKDLDQDQKAEVRAMFRNAVHGHLGNKRAALARVAEQIAREMIDNKDMLPDEYIPPEYDGRLLAISRARIGKNLTAKQRAEVRQMLKDALARSLRCAG